MILMSMRENYGLEFVAVLQQIAHVRNDQVNAQQVCAGKHQAAVNGDGGIAIFDEHHIEAKLAQSA
jgi:hypothetical protein